MSEATHKEPKANLENLEQTTWTLEEAETKLKEELKKFQDAGKEILNQYGNIANIQKEIEETKQIIVKLQADEKTKYNYPTPQNVFKEFKKVYREKCKKSIRKRDRFRLAFLSPIPLLIIIFLISYILSAFCETVLANYKSYIFRGYIFSVVAFLLIAVIRIFKKDLKEKSINRLDIIITILSSVFAIFFITDGLLNNSYEILEKLKGYSRIYLVVIIVLLFVLSCIDNAYKNFSKKEKENATLSIEEVLGKEVSADLLKTLIKFQDEIGDEAIGDFKNSFIYKLIIFLGGGSLVLKLPDILNITNIETELQLYVKLLIFFVVLFFLLSTSLYEEKIYLEGLKDMEFKEVLEQSKKGR